MISKQQLIDLGVTKILAYNRKSRADADEEETLSRHKQILEDALTPLGIPFEVRSEIGSSEDLESRIVLNKILEDISLGNANAICYVEQSRLSRDVGLMSQLFKFFKKNNITLIDLKNNNVVDLEDDAQDDYRFLESIMDNVYMRSAKKVLMRGRRHSASQGYSLIKRMYGYIRNNETKKMDIVEDEAVCVKLMYDMCYQGYSNKAIAHHINEIGYRSINGNLFTYKQVWSILKSKAYKGTAVWNKQAWDKVDGKWKPKKNPDEKVYEVENAWEPIIEPKYWDKVNHDHAMRSINLAKKDFASTYWASGLMRCSVCGRKLTVFKKSNKIQVRACQKTDLTTGYKVCQIAGGVLRGIEEDLINNIEQHKQSLQDFITNYTKDSRDESEIKKKIAKTKKELDATKVKLSKLMDLLESGTYTIEQYNERSNLHKEKVKRLELNLKQLEEELLLDPTDSAHEAIEKIDKVIETIRDCEDGSARNRLWRSIIQEIRWTKTGSYVEPIVEIIYKS